MGHTTISWLPGCVHVYMRIVYLHDAVLVILGCLLHKLWVWNCLVKTSRREVVHCKTLNSDVITLSNSSKELLCKSFFSKESSFLRVSLERASRETPSARAFLHEESLSRKRPCKKPPCNQPYPGSFPFSQRASTTLLNDRSPSFQPPFCVALKHPRGPMAASCSYC